MTKNTIAITEYFDAYVNQYVSKFHKQPTSWFSYLDFLFLNNFGNGFESDEIEVARRLFDKINRRHNE